MTVYPKAEDIKNSGVDIKNIGLGIEGTGVFIKTSGVQNIAHKDENDEHNDASEVSDKVIPEGYLHHPQLTLPTERRIFNLIPRKLRNYYKHIIVDDYVHAQIVHYAIT